MVRHIRLAGALVVLAATLSCLLDARPALSADDNIDEIVGNTVTAKTSAALPSCHRTAENPWPGLTVQGGRVVRAALLDEIDGYARAAGTTGGLGGKLLIVTVNQDYDPDKHQPTVSGSLRAAVEAATREQTPAWIVFDPALGPGTRIEMKAHLRLPDNITLDGTCSDVMLEAPSNVITAFIAAKKNIVIARLAFHKTDYYPGLPDADSESAIRLNGAFDKIAILHNDLSECGDGCIDITVSPKSPVPDLARVTVAYNFLHDHDKVMLFGTFTCPKDDGQTCDDEYFEANRNKRPGLYLTLDGNLFLRTGQRHPRVFGRVMAHVLNNVVAFQRQRRPDGKFGAGYGIFVSNDARALVEHNTFVALAPTRKIPTAVWTVTTPDAEKMPNDVEGFVRLDGNRVAPPAVATGDDPDEVPAPGYEYRTEPLADLTVGAAIACVADRAGRTGGSHWNDKLCAPGQ